MKKVLIIDDDALVRMFLRQMIPWEQEGYRIIGDARDGEEGMQMFREFRPDLVITDVSMPVMNGIDFLKAIKKEAFHGGIIMLSCHEDFEYVKTAMALGADEYLLKNHLSADSLREVLQTVTARMDKRVHEMNQQDELVAYAQKGIIEIKKEVLQKLLENEKYLAEQQQLFARACITGTFRQCAAILVRLPAYQKEKEDAFYELCQQIAVSNHAEMIILQERLCVFLIDLTEYPSARKQHELLMSLQQIIHNYMWEYLGIKLSSGISEICTKDDAVVRAVRQAEKALLIEFYEQGAWSYQEACELSDTCPPEAESLESELWHLLKLGDEIKLARACAQAVKGIAQKRVTPRCVCDWLRRCDRSVGLMRAEEEYAHMDSLERLKECTSKYILYLYDLQLAKTPDNLSTSIKNAVDYMNGHYGEGCSLGEVAEYVGLTPTYLSARFKQEMGVGFVEYLTEVRIGQAQWLIRKNRHDTIKSISEQTGFTDYQHFCKVFKKKVGYSPAVFRKRNLK